jgi:surface protein
MPAFITQWKTDNFGMTEDNQIRLPTIETGNYNFTVDWGDGNSDDITEWDAAEVTHTYASAGTYTVEITGTFEGIGWCVDNTAVTSCDEQKLLLISQWGDLRLGNEGGYFTGCSNLTISATDSIVLTGVTNFHAFFTGCTSLDTVPNSGSWDVSNVTNMCGVFENCPLFNDDISGWNTGSVQDMCRMFKDALVFNQNIGSWDLSSCTSIQLMFSGAVSFNQDIGSWDVSNVTRMDSAFENAFTFNQDIGSWTTTSLQVTQNMFYNATNFNQDISGWDVSNVINMFRMFRDSAFNQDLSSWAVGNVVEMEEAFHSSDMNTVNYDATKAAWALLTNVDQLP